MTTMKNTNETKNAIVGVSFGTNVYYNIVENDPEFEYTGLAVISWLNHDNNRFIGEMFESQSYESIVRILDDDIDYGVFCGSNDNKNTTSMQQMYSFITGGSDVSHVYIYDVFNDVLLVKTPEMDQLTAVEYKNSADVREFRNSLRW